MKRRGKRLYLACSGAAGRARSRVATVGLFDTLKLCIYQAFDFKQKITFGSAVGLWRNESPTNTTLRPTSLGPPNAKRTLALRPANQSIKRAFSNLLAHSRQRGYYQINNSFN
jgi:hypothetical protein